jgi:hypothetical protein
MIFGSRGERKRTVRMSWAVSRIERRDVVGDREEGGCWAGRGGGRVGVVGCHCKRIW